MKMLPWLRQPFGKGSGCLGLAVAVAGNAGSGQNNFGGR